MYGAESTQHKVLIIRNTEFSRQLTSTSNATKLNNRNLKIPSKVLFFLNYFKKILLSLIEAPGK